MIASVESWIVVSKLEVTVLVMDGIMISWKYYLVTQSFTWSQSWLTILEVPVFPLQTLLSRMSTIMLLVHSKYDENIRTPTNILVPFEKKKL